MCQMAGYAGRTELPDNLKSMFRPISMVVPDSTLIAEIILFGEGFNNCKVRLLESWAGEGEAPPSAVGNDRVARVQGVQPPAPSLPQILAKKVYTLYSLAVQQLSKQDHYDFGLRALTSLLRYAGKKRRVRPDLTDEEVRSPSLFCSFAQASPVQIPGPWFLRQFTCAIRNGEVQVSLLI